MPVITHHFVFFICGQVKQLFCLPSRRLNLSNDGRGPAAPSATSCPEQPDVCSGEATRPDSGDGNRLLHYKNQKDKRRDPKTGETPVFIHRFNSHGYPELSNEALDAQ